MSESNGMTGFFGKLPSHGDFISRGLPSGFLKYWDEWLQNVITCSREQLGDGWLDAYLTSPIWRFVLSSNIVGEQAWAGILMPSVDRVGRYFPLTIAAPVGADLALMQVAELADSWFEQVDEIALSTLEDDCDLGDLEQRLTELDSPVSDGLMSAAKRIPGRSRQPKLAMRSGIVSVDSMTTVFPILASRVLGATLTTYGLWWTRGSDRVSPSVLVTEGLPPVQGFAAFLDGQWTAWGWDDDAASTAPMAGTSGTAPL